MRCDDLVFQIDTITNQMHYQSDEVPHKGHVVEVAAGAQPSAVQRGWPSMPPADSTEGCAAHGPISTASKKRSMGMAQLPSFMPTPRGKGRKGVAALREMCGSSVRLMKGTWIRKARPLGTRLGPRAHWASAGGIFGPLFRQTDGAGPLFRQTDFCDTSRPTSSIRQARLRTTPFSHAFRPRFPATPKPRLSATSFSHAFGPCLPTCHSDRGRCVFVTANSKTTFIPQSQLPFIIEVSEAQIFESGKSFGVHATSLCGR